MTHTFSFYGSLTQYWEILYAEYRRMNAALKQPPFEIMSPSRQDINEYIPKNEHEIVINFWDKEHKHVVLVVEAETIPDEEVETVMVYVHPQGNSFEEPVKTAMLMWKKIKTELDKTNLESKQKAVINNNITIKGNVIDSNIIVGSENEANINLIKLKKKQQR